MIPDQRLLVLAATSAAFGFLVGLLVSSSMERATHRGANTNPEQSATPAPSTRSDSARSGNPDAAQPRSPGPNQTQIRQPAGADRTGRRDPDTGAMNKRRAAIHPETGRHGHYAERAYESALAVASLSLQEIEQYLRESNDNIFNDDSWVLRQGMLTRWAQNEPAEAMRFLDGLDSSRRNQWTDLVLEIWARTDPSAADTWMERQSSGERRRLAHAYIRGLTENDPERARSKIESIAATDSALARALENTWLSIWADREPEAAFTWAAATPPAPHRMQHLHLALTKWLRKDPASAAARAQNLYAQTGDTSLLELTADAWARIDPDRAMAWANTLENTALRDRLLTRVIRAIGWRHPAEALPWLKQIPLSRETASTMQGLLSAWINAYPDRQAEALTAIEALPDRLARDRALQTLAQTLASVLPYTPANSLCVLDKISDPCLKQAALENLITTLAQSNPQWAIDYVAKLDQPRRSILAAKIAGPLSQDNPDRIDAFLTQFATDLAPQEWASLIAKIAQFDAARAFKLCQKIPAGTGRNTAERMALEPWARKNPADALAYAANMPKSDDQINTVRRLLHIWAETDLPAALQWAEKNSDPQMHNPLTGVLSDWANWQPEQAASYVAKMPAGSNSLALANLVLARWAEASPSGAGRWAVRFTDESKTNACLTVLRSWCRRDAASAVEWIEQATSDSLRDVLLLETATQLAAQTPAYAAALADRLTDPAQREQGLARVFTRWVELDKEAAGKWLNSCRLPEERKRALLDAAVHK